MEIFQLFADLVVHPSRAFEKALSRKFIWFPGIFLFFVGILFTLGAYLGLEKNSAFDSLQAQNIKFLIIFIRLGPVLFIGFWIIASGFLHLASKASGGKGSFSDTLIVVGFSFPIFVLSFTLTGLVVRLLPETRFLRILTIDTMRQCALVIWLIFLMIFGLRKAHQISLRKAIKAILIACLYFIGVYLIYGGVALLLWRHNMIGFGIR